MGKIKAVFKCDAFEKVKFKDSRCLLTVSMGQEAQTGERFSATMDLINNSFPECIISFHDGLQRYTMALIEGKDPSLFMEIPQKEGDLWLARHRKNY